ncbi:hypothetical protein Niako_5984 [Niastella koreensis GR20-10]|uniref:Uncharacterized protein n=2 Tax=Niastella koreensis TaxID=354356 RepID=G8TRR6_NIAKG|nr:hypothetical protein Niako_5984 [Niastella koreensis GR20-10]
MSDYNKIPPSTDDLSSGKSDPVISLLLQALDNRADQLKQDIAISQEMVKLGIDTDLIGLIKKVVDNPLNTLMEGRNTLDSHVAGIFTAIIKSYLERHKDKVYKAFRTETKSNDLHFTIILNEDNFENREILLEILVAYHQTQFAELYPIYFQFAPKDLESKIPVKELLLA